MVLFEHESVVSLSTKKQNVEVAFSISIDVGRDLDCIEMCQGNCSLQIDSMKSI